MVYFRRVLGSQILDSIPLEVPVSVFFERRATGATARIMAVGDIAFSGAVRLRGEESGFHQLFSEVFPVLRHGDVVFGNLESPFTDLPRTVHFSAPLESASSIADAGFTLLHLANNHIYDHGANGLNLTLEAIRPFAAVLGAGGTTENSKDIVRTDIGGIRIGWLGCGRTDERQDPNGPVYWEFNKQELFDAVRNSRANVDVLVVSIHIGYMFLDVPSPEHKQLASDLIELGVTLVLFHHPHVLQGISTFHNAAACYSLGNFLFDPKQGNSPPEDKLLPIQNEGAIFVLDVDKDGLAFAAVIPTWLDNDMVIRLATDERGTAILDRFQSLTLLTNSSECESLFQEQRVSRNTGRTIYALMRNLKKGRIVYVIKQLRRVRWTHFPMLSRFIYRRFLSLR